MEYKMKIESSSRMSIDHSKEQTSPNLENQIRQVDAHNGGLMQTLANERRSRRSYSMVSSLDKLTNKLKSTLADHKQTVEKDRHKQNANVTNVKPTADQYIPHGGYVKEKRFIEENTKEVLIIARDGCYTYQSRGENQLIISKLNDVREILDTGL